MLVSVRTEPQSFSRFTRQDATTDLVNYLTQARLVRINRQTYEVEPWLAESWTRSDDGLTYTAKLRPNLSFSDGHPFTADDVLFSLTLAYDAKGGGPVMSGLLVGGKPITATAPDPLTVVIRFPAVYAPGMLIFDDLPIVPKHKLEAALKAGTFADTWSLSSPLTDIAGLGPFVISSYQPGQRLVFARNDRYFRKDASGVQLPYLDRIVLDIVPDQSAQVLRLEAGQSDMLADEVRQEDYSRFKRAADAGRVQLFDLGVSLAPDSFWFNLKTGAFAKDPRSGWIQRDELRQAISLAVDRQVYLDTVSLGAGVPVFGLVTPATKRWYSPDVPAHTPHDPARARQLLASIGLTDRNGDGVLEDAHGAPARFSISTQKGRTTFERGAAVIRDELKKIGLTVDVVPLEGNALVGRLASGQGYDAALFQLGVTNPEPAMQLSLWLSSGPFHVWNVGAKTPTAWEKQVDDLMARQISTLDEAERQRLFLDVQKIFADHLPILNFAAPNIFAAASSRATNLTPSVIRPQFLWAPDTIAIKR